MVLEHLGRLDKRLERHFRIGPALQGERNFEQSSEEPIPEPLPGGSLFHRHTPYVDVPRTLETDYPAYYTRADALSAVGQDWNPVPQPKSAGSAERGD